MTDEHRPTGAPALPTWRFGQTWWCGNECLLCTGVIDGSHTAVKVAEYDEATRTSLCPNCGALVLWPEPPEVYDDPRCSACRDCPSTLRDASAGGAGGSNDPAPAGGRKP